MSTYETIQGDTWDLIAYKLFGDEKYMENLIVANWELLDILVFSSGTVINVPELPDESDSDLPFWRQEDDDDEEETGYEEEDGDEE